MRRLLLVVLLASSARAAEIDDPNFPPANELFARLLADPRQTQTTAQYYRLWGMDIAEVALGNAWGIRRWNAGRDGGVKIQADVEGMAYSVFKLSGSVNEFETVDFFANLPVEIRRGPLSGRFTLFHESSHLGDDYIRRMDSAGGRYSIEGARAVASYDLPAGLRVYGGFSYLLHRIPASGRRGAQAGFEWTSGELRRREPRCRAYLAQDFQSKEAIQWNVNSSTQLGVRLGFDGVRRSLRLHVDHFEGHSELGQFFRTRLGMNSVGASFDF
jgi:hypothetical protein